MHYRDIFGKPTPTPYEVAKKHKVPELQILLQLDKGIEIENEHTNDKRIAREIALDHLSELPDYYDQLERMEQQGEKEDDKT